MTADAVWNRQENRNQRTTSVKAQSYRDKKQSGRISELQDKTLRSLYDFQEKYGFQPTCQELKRFISETKDWYDPMKTQMQPRLTSELPENDMVESNGEKLSMETGEETTKWKITEKGRRYVHNQ